MVQRIAVRLRRIRAELEEVRAHLETADETLQLLIPNVNERISHTLKDVAKLIDELRNIETVAGPEAILLRLGNDADLLTQVLNTINPNMLHIAWCNLTPEKQAEIKAAECDD